MLPFNKKQQNRHSEALEWVLGGRAESFYLRLHGLFYVLIEIENRPLSDVCAIFVVLLHRTRDNMKWTALYYLSS